MKKIIKSAFKALVIGLAVVAFCPMVAEKACAESVAPATTGSGSPVAAPAGNTAAKSVTPETGAKAVSNGKLCNPTVIGGAVGGTVGAAAGTTAGVIIGGVGIAACGTGIGIPVGVVCLTLATVGGAAGAGIGSLIGSLF